ncbi:MAG: hypothetical protein EHM70_21620 [Chloroflexota bacterium]|nr:MAG: hypothetical protein EHM70_21620 [Chloroflexota bacterium]
MMTRKRTWAVWVLAALAVLAGIVDLLDAARYMGWLPVAGLGDLNFFIANANWLGALLSAVVGVIWFVVAKWLYDLNPNGWVFVAVIAVFNLIVLGLALLGRSSWAAVSLGVIVNAIALILAMLPGTKEAFAQTEV